MEVLQRLGTSATCSDHACHARRAGWSLWGLGVLGVSTDKGIKQNLSIFAYTMYPGLFRTADDERGWSCATVTMRPRWLWWCGGWHWLLQFGNGRPSLDDKCERTEADRRAEDLLLVRVWACTASACALPSVHRWSGSTCPQVDRYRVGCHVMLAAARGESLSDPRKERVRFEPGPRFWGTYSPCPLSAVLRLRNPLARPQLSFYHGAAIGVRDTSMPRSCTVSPRQI